MSRAPWPFHSIYCESPQSSSAPCFYHLTRKDIAFAAAHSQGEWAPLRLPAPSGNHRPQQWGATLRAGFQTGDTNVTEKGGCSTKPRQLSSVSAAQCYHTSWLHPLLTSGDTSKLDYQRGQGHHCRLRRRLFRESSDAGTFPLLFSPHQYVSEGASSINPSYLSYRSSADKTVMQLHSSLHYQRSNISPEKYVEIAEYGLGRVASVAYTAPYFAVFELEITVL
jgi:hypothetical protein